MRINRNLSKPAALLAVVCLFLAFSSTAEAARLLGLTASTPDTADTSRIVLIDTANGTFAELADTLLSRSTAVDATNSTSGPNGLAYDPGTGTAYFASVPTAGGGPTILYSVVVDPPGGTPVSTGNPAGTALSDAAFFDGRYWYIPAGTDDLRSITFNPGPGGTIASDNLVAELLTPGGDTLVFGDIGIKDGILHGSARRDPGGDVVFFTVDLNPASGDFLVYMQHLSGAPGDPVPLGPVMQLGFGDDGTLFGVTGALSGANDLYYVSRVPGSLGERGLVLEDFAGGPFTDMAQFNPVCDCPRECQECDGGLTEMTIRFNGGSTTLVRVDSASQGVVTLFSGNVDPGGLFTLIGTLVNGRIHNEIDLFENGSHTGDFHVSCSSPIGPGSTSGNFEVVEAISTNGGLVCPLSDEQ